METFNIKIKDKGIIPVSAPTWQDAIDIVQAYIDKRSLDWIINYE